MFKPEMHRVYAVTEDRTRVPVSDEMEWPEAVKDWYWLDNFRIDGAMPHVLFFAVRAVDDPAWPSDEPKVPYYRWTRDEVRMRLGKEI